LSTLTDKTCDYAVFRRVAIYVSFK